MKLDAKVWILIFTVFLNLTGFGLILPLFALYAEDIGMTPTIIGITISAYSIGQLITAPFWGRLSDSIGRRPIMIWTLLGFALSYVMLGFAESAVMLFVARAVSGVFAGNISTAYAVMSDMTSGADRGRGMGLLGAAFGIGLVAGPGMVGLIAPFVDEADLFFVTCQLAAVMTLVAMLATYFYLPETLAEDKRRPFGVKKEKKDDSDSTVKKIRPVLYAIVAMSFVSVLSISLITPILPLWAETDHGLDAAGISYIYVFIGLISAAVQGVAIGPLMKRFSGWTVTLWGFVFLGIGMFSITQFSTLLPLALGFLLMAVGSSASNPALTALVSMEADEDEAGAVMGVFTAAGSLSRILGPLVAGWAYDSYGHTSPFYFAAFVMVPAIIAVVITKSKARSAAHAAS